MRSVTNLATKAILICLTAVVISYTSGCSSLNDNPPDYIKDVVAYNEGGNGLVVYFILADSTGAMTTADGEVQLTIGCPYGVRYDHSFTVSKGDFRKASVGLGAFEHDVIAYSFGRIEYSELALEPRPSGRHGVVIEFSPSSGGVIRGNTDVEL